MLIWHGGRCSCPRKLSYPLAPSSSLDRPSETEICPGGAHLQLRSRDGLESQPQRVHATRPAVLLSPKTSGLEETNKMKCRYTVCGVLKVMFYGSAYCLFQEPLQWALGPDPSTMDSEPYDRDPIRHLSINPCRGVLTTSHMSCRLPSTLRNDGIGIGRFRSLTL